MRRKYKTIKIFTKSGKLILFNEDDWDDYYYDEKFFTIVKNNIEVCRYNLDRIATIVMK